LGFTATAKDAPTKDKKQLKKPKKLHYNIKFILMPATKQRNTFCLTEKKDITAQMIA
jgi:hypothetical protein